MAQMLDGVAERGEGIFLLLGRLGIAALYLPSGFGKLSNAAGFAGYLSAHGVAGPTTVLAYIAGLIEFLGALAILFGFQTRAAAALLCIFTIVAAFIGHPYWAADESSRMMQYVHFWKDIAIAGGLLFLFVRGAGPLAVDRR
jgi:putative oxidoreductase